MSHSWPCAVVALWASVFPGCEGWSAPPPLLPASAALHEPGLRGASDPTVHGARLFPETLREARVWGAEPGGGVRATVSGVRFVSWGDGSLVVASDRLPWPPSRVVEVPGRMGGGFLFVQGGQVWRAETWLGVALPAYRSASPIGDVLVGLDRVYVWFSEGALAAIDPRSGAALGLGPLPSSPHLGRLAALDAWRAVAIADFRGVMVTLDAGSSWRPLSLPIDPAEVALQDGEMVVRGLDEGRRARSWTVRGDGQAARIELPAPRASPSILEPPLDSRWRTFGPRPRVAAVEDGWPLEDGTALVARDGSLARVRLGDGAIVEGVANAFALNPARCSGISLARPSDPRAFGFVCGEPRGRTAAFRWDAAGSRMVELRRFDRPREILAFGNGALAARGSCKPESGDDAATGERAWCAMSPAGVWTELRLTGEDLDRARLVVLADGRVALVRPPVGDLATAGLSLTGASGTTHVALKMPALRDDAGKALLRGVWLDGFEERRPGVLGGWVDAAGSVLGVEIALDGEVRVGEFIRDAGAPVASSRWALGWTASRRGFETTDGGMTWTKGIEMADPIAGPNAVHERACGPVGCIAAGWLRIGWGGASGQPAPPLPPVRGARATRAPTFRIQCERSSGDSSAARASATSTGRPSATTALFAPGSEFTPSCGQRGPTRSRDQPGLAVDVADAFGWPRRNTPLATIYTWGPDSGDWDRLGRWEVRWQGASKVCSSSAGVAPWKGLDAAVRALGRGGGPAATAWTLALADEVEHGLLVGRHTAGADVFVLENGRSPLEVRPSGGEPFPEIEAAIRAGGRWYFATSQAPSQLASTVLWAVDGGVARELIRVPRTGSDSRSTLRLARRGDGRSVGLVVEGRPDATQGARLWVASVDLETRAVGDPEPLAPLDLSQGPVTLCTGDDSGWLLEWPYPGAIEINIGSGPPLSLQSNLVRMRLSQLHACVERVVGFPAEDGAGSAQGQVAAALAPAPSLRTIEGTILYARGRVSLRCTQP